MKKAPIILGLIMVAILLAGCTETAITDPIVGTWRDKLIGASQMEFSIDHHYYASTIDISYDGNWSNIDANHYLVYFTRVDNNSSLYSVIIDYDSLNKTIAIDSQPDIYYSKIEDVIQGNWTDQLQSSIMQFKKDHSWRMVIGNSSYNASYYGNWSKINNTSYYVDYTNYSNITNIYREMIFYNRSDNTIQLDNIPYAQYSRI